MAQINGYSLPIARKSPSHYGFQVDTIQLERIHVKLQKSYICISVDYRARRHNLGYVVR